MTNLLNEVEHVVSGVEPKVPCKQDDIIVVLPSVVGIGSPSGLT